MTSLKPPIEGKSGIGGSPLYGVNPLKLPIKIKPHSKHIQKSYSSTRKAIHRGKTIKIRTTYRIEIDGEPLQVHVKVMDDGTVHCHGVPNYSFGSAIEMVRSIIDASRLSYVDRDELNQSIDMEGDHGQHS